MDAWIQPGRSRGRIYRCRALREALRYSLNRLAGLLARRTEALRTKLEELRMVCVP